MRAADFQAGAASVDITPPPGVPMAGYYFVRYNQGTLDPLSAKAIVFEKDGSRAAVVALDLIGVPRDVVEQARVLVEGLTTVPGAHVMISATHSHTGPEIGTRVVNVDPGALARWTAWRNALPGKIADAVKAAEARLRPVPVRAAVTKEESVSFVRRFRMVDGTVAWNPGKLNPRIQAPVGTIDPDLSALFVGDLATYVNFANHLDTVGGTAYSADYAGALSRVLQSVHGASHTGVFTLGCAGNINHIDVRRADPQKGAGEAARIGAILAADVLKSQPGAKVLAVGRPKVASVVVPLPLAPFEAAEVAQAKEVIAHYGGPEARPFYDQVRAFKVAELAARNGAPLDAEVQVISLGDQVAFVGLPGEIFADLGKSIKAASPFPVTIVVSLANGSLGYIPDRRAYAEGAYEVVSSRVREGGGELLVEAAGKLLTAARSKE